MIVIALNVAVAIAVIAWLAATAWLAVADGRRSRAQAWAARRGVALTERAEPFVDTYLRNARNIRLVCGVGAVALVAAFSAGVGTDLGGSSVAWVLGGYLAGSVWAELSLARVPASPTRVASLVVREPRRYLRRWVAAAQVLAPIGTILLAMTPLAAEPERGLVPAVGRWGLGATAWASAGLALVSLAVTVAAQRWIVRRPLPHHEADLVAADETMRTSAVHLLGLTHVVLCLLLALTMVLNEPVMNRVERVRSADLTAPFLVGCGALALVALVLWMLRLQPPGSLGGAVPPPQFTADAATEIKLADPEEDKAPSWRARRRPDLAALVVVGALCAGLVGLRWLGPVNPAVAATVTEQARRSGPPSGERMDVTVTVRNDSLLGVDVHVMPFSSLGPNWGLALTRPPGTPFTGGPIHVDGRSEAQLTVSVPLDPCPVGPVGPYSLGAPSVEARTASGRTTAVRTSSAIMVEPTCNLALPTGPQPEDPVAARAQVEAAFGAVYGPNPLERPPGPIDRPDGVRATTEAALRGALGHAVQTTQITVKWVAFDRPDHAWVVYDLRHSLGGTGNRRGEAVLVDGTWKVTRETVCADLAMAGSPCA